ncbi:MAG: hypothetical protein ABJA71_15430 [Ginsengibacter sp.]
MKQIELVQTKNLAEVGEDIGLSEGKQLVKAFREANPDATTGYYIGRNILDQILAQPGCVGINFRKCLTEMNQEHLVYTGVDAEGKDILEFSVVTNTGDLVNQNGIVADKIWIERSKIEEAVETIFDI